MLVAFPAAIYSAFWVLMGSSIGKWVGLFIILTTLIINNLLLFKLVYNKFVSHEINLKSTTPMESSNE